MTGLFNSITGNLRTKLMAMGLLAGTLGLSPTLARADDNGRYGDRDGRDYRHGDERRYDRRDSDRDRRDRTDVKVDINFGSRPRPRYTERRVRYWIEPEFKTVCERVWVEPVYRTTTERVWVEPVFKTVYEVVCVPARYEMREISTRIGPARVSHRERVLVEPESTRRVATEVLVSDGYWKTTERRVCVSEGRWNNVEQQVCVSEGRWDYRVERVEVDRDTETRVDFRF